MMHLSDRRRVELALPANLLHRAVSAAIDPGERSADDLHVLRWLQQAAWEPLDGLNLAERRRVTRRVDRVAEEVIADLTGGAKAKAFLALVLWVKGLIDEGTLVLVEDSAFALGADAVIATMTDAPDVIAAVDRSATKAARRICETLRRQGYYPVSAREAAE